MATAVAVVSGGTAAVAGTLITSQNIQDGTIRPVDLAGKLKKKIYRKSSTLAAAIPGQAGAKGATGATGAAGADAEFTAGHWGVMDRNTIGSPVAELRAGPFIPGAAGAVVSPPFGEGSLGLEVADNALSGGTPQEKVSYGNEVDFLGDPVSGLNQVEFSVFQTGEDAAIGTSNLPNISLEINPHVAGKTYTSMVYVPDPISAATIGAQSWQKINAAAAPTTNGWYFTNGTVGTETGCNQVTFCSLATAKAALVTKNDGSGAASILTVAVGKGRDKQWQGAVDGLRINNTIFDFEPLGVEEIPAP